jgi:putative oxidoreductase
MKPWFDRSCQKMNAAIVLLQSPFLLLVRLYWGWQFAQTGWGKLHHIARVTGFFTDLGIPFPHASAIWVALLEFVGGILLAVGFLSRPVAFLLAFDMLVAYLTADREAFAAFFTDPGKFTGASPFTFLAASLIILVFGPGRIAVDAIIHRAGSSRD